MMSDDDMSEDDVISLTLMCSWDTLKNSLRKVPSGCWKRDSHGKTALHILCSIGPNLDGNFNPIDKKEHLHAAKLLIDASITAVPEIIGYCEDNSDYPPREVSTTHFSILTVPDENGNTPLHTLTSNFSGHVSLGLLELILLHRPEYGTKRFPSPMELLSLTNCHGCTPLHFIAEGWSSMESVKKILDYCPCDKKDLEAPLLLRMERLSDTFDFFEPRYAAPVRHPLLIQDEDGEIPLHYACFTGQSEIIAEMLRIGPPSAVFIRSNSGKLPIDALQSGWYQDRLSTFHPEPDGISPSPELITLERDYWKMAQHILKAAYLHHRHARTIDTQSTVWKPLHAAAGVDLPVFVLALAVRMADSLKEDLSQWDDDGLCPLHVACSFRASSSLRDDERIGYLLDIYKTSPLSIARLTTRDGRSAFHLAVENGKGFSQSGGVLKRLCDAAPEVLSKRDPRTGLYPFMLAAVENNNEIDVIFQLLIMSPELVC